MRETMSRRPKRITEARPSTRRAVARGPGSRHVSTPDARVVDLARVVEARRRIASGWYDRSDVRDRLVDAVLHEIRGR